MKKQSRKNKCAKFIKILYSMLRNSQAFLTWSADQTYFTINNILGFIQNSLPIHFKHSNLSSFIRQLNLYGFKKLPTINDDTPQNSYYHQYFKKKEPNLLYKIQRRFIKKSERLTHKNQSLDSSSERGQSDKQVYLSKLQQCQNQLKKLWQQNYKLAQQNGGLKQAIRQAQMHILTRKNMGINQLGMDRIPYLQNTFFSPFNSFESSNIGFPCINYNRFEHLSNMNAFSSQNSQDPDSKSLQNHKQ